ncbi:enhancin-3 [Betabaculovirus altermyunipunctae]|uniref:Enhancin-3 n=1 Tax=Betabaculovirus altermyunipunctae TaxID=3051996 RepID=A0A1S5YE77_9BBAC|nr:enhancin-3 [Betabaculovirus altermyunipunctae]AQQ80406.1 enhancin-3 [Betabaculovirus altermyunipunctae]
MALVISVVAPVVRRPPWVRSHQNSFLGIRHKRKPVPYIVTPQTLLRYRTTTPNTPTVLRLLNNNSRTESRFAPTADWQISVGHNEGVLFVDCIEQGEAVVEVELGGSMSPLPVFYYNDTDEADFKSQLGNASYAWLDLLVVSILVPPASIAALRSVPLVPLHLFYREIISFYDSFVGLVDDPTMISTNSNTNKQFFVKSDITGAGTAYYGTDWTANSHANLGPYLEPSVTNWLVLHEIGHAYDFGFTQYDTLLIEVWNNILCDRFQFHCMNKPQRQAIARIYEGRRPQVEEEQAGLIETRVNLDLWGHFQKLVFFVWLMNFDSSVFLAMNRSFRLRNSAHVRQPHHWVWLASLSEYDLVPLLHLCNATPAHYLRLINQLNVGTQIPPNSILPYNLLVLQLISFKKCLYPINQVVTNFDMDNNEYNIKQYVETNYTLFTPLLTKQLGIYVNFTLTVHIDNIAEVSYDTLTVYDGLDVVARTFVPETGRIALSGLTPGVYAVHHPRGRQNYYKVCYDGFADHEHYIVVHQNTTNIDLRYTKRSISDYEDEEAFLLGFDQIVMGVMYVNGPERRVYLYINTIHCSPNQGDMMYHDVRFVHIDNTESSLVMLGNNSTLGHGWHKFRNVRHLIIHSLRGGCIFLETMLPTQAVRFALTDAGVMLDTDQSISFPTPQQRLTTRVNRHCKWLDNNPMALIIENDVRDNVYLATRYKETARYDRYYPNRVRKTGVNYEFLFAGTRGVIHLQLLARMLENIGTLVVEPSDVGASVDVDSVYMGVQVKNTKDDVVVRVVCLGNEPLEAQHHDFPLCEDYTVQLFHLEPTNRLSVTKNFEPVPDFHDNNRDVFMIVRGGRLVITDGPSLLDD